MRIFISEETAILSTSELLLQTILGKPEGGEGIWGALLTSLVPSVAWQI